MPRGDFLPDIILPPDGLRDAVQLACHPLAPLISIAVRTLSAACVDGWVPTNHLSPSVVLCTTGTVGGILKLTPKKVEEVISAMEKGGLFETRDDGAKRMADQVKIAEAVAESNVRNARRESRRKSRSSKISNLDAVCLTKRGQCLTNGKTTEDIGTASSHNDAPVQTVTDQDRHYLGIPSGCFKKEEGEGEKTNAHARTRTLTLVPSEPAPHPLPKQRRRKHPPMRSKQETIDYANEVLPRNEHHPAWFAFGYIMDSKWAIGGIDNRDCWEIPGFDAVRIAQKLGAPQYDSVPKDEILRACDRLDVARDTKSDLGLYLLGWFNREIKFQAERSSRYGGLR